MDQTADLTTNGFARWSGTTKRERNFWIALACAAVLHASLFVGAIASKPKRLGAENGADNAISVSLVTEADLESKSTIADEPQPPPGPPPSPAQKPQPAKQPPKPQEAKQDPQPPQPEQPPQKPEKLQQKVEQPPAPDDVKQEEKPEQKVAKTEDPKPEENAPDLFSLQDENPANMKSEPKPKPEPKSEAKKSSPHKSSPKKKKRMASLDLSTPKSLLAPSFGGGGSAGLQRPPGITRSGVNDAFARAVIRALQQTMPQLSDVLGRVTVRIFLTETGNVAEVRLLSGSKNPSLNQSVIFAARQTSYPIPPTGSNVADRTFMVTYIYD
ncbi:TonB family protein [Hyphomicrobium sp.]|jgi:TonB family protein|uniref:energy transducer TonB family protein n=1 Tax=Hyphomicrobium sp. TaxID=82 RepID=UPI002BDE7F97|nr:TonB family protein [Hyphomicrobium sp.]HVZ04483.1 TonB family protein [Hyphomicrobium sp.]